MPTFELGELAQASGGSLLRGEPGTQVRSYVIDTRRIESGGVFFALAGTRTDGHKFLGEAAENGAAAAMIERDLEPDEKAPPGLIRVDDAVEALACIGKAVRRKLHRTQWLAVTGSNGKTTTKEMLAAAMADGNRVHRTAGNYNNHLGVPLTMLACPDDTDVAVTELAMSAAGEIAHLAQMVDPDVGLVTNVRAAHLKYFGSLDDIAAAKGELFAVLRDDAVSVVNLDDPQVRVQAARHGGRRVTFGQHTTADLKIEHIDDHFLPGAAMTFRYEGKAHRLQLRISGAHSAFNALAALAAVVAAGGNLESAVERVQTVEAGEGRGKVHRLARDMLLVDDSYNSSPAALASVLETLKASRPPGRKVLVMGDMLELGNLEGAMHREAGKRAAKAGVQLMIAVGSLARGSAEAARRSGVQEVHHHPDSKQAADSIPEFLKDGDLIVVKGSRSVRLGRVVRRLTEQLRQTG